MGTTQPQKENERLRRAVSDLTLDKSILKAAGSGNFRSAWESGYCDGFKGRMRDELLNGEVFYALREAPIIIDRLGEPAQY